MYNAVLFIHWLACRVKVFDLAGTVTQKFAKRPPAIALNNNGPLSLSVGKIPRLVRVKKKKKKKKKNNGEYSRNFYLGTGKKRTNPFFSN